VSAQIDWDNLPDQADLGRWRVLAAARQYLLGRDLATMTVDVIASEAGIGKPTFYTLFRSRDEFMDRLRDAVTADAAAEAEAAAAGPWEGIFGRMVRAVAEWIGEYPGLAPLFAPEYLASPERPSRDMMVTIVRSVLEAGVRGGVFHLAETPGMPPDRTIDATANVVFEVLSGVTRMVGAGREDIAAISEAFLEQALGFDRDAAASPAEYRPPT
jgi:AcrR family transcriptional regulator